MKREEETQKKITSIETENERQPGRVGKNLS